MDELAQRILSGLVASGPLALCLALAVYKLWDDNQKLRKQIRSQERRLRDDYRRLAGLEDSNAGEA